MSSSFRDIPGPIPAAYDPRHAQDILKTLSQDAPAALADENFSALLESAAGSSPYLARLILREKDFLDDIYDVSPDRLLASLNDEVLTLAEESDIAAAMRRLRAAKRKAALTIALADIAELYDLDAVTGALTRFAAAALKGALRHLLRGVAADTEFAGLAPDELEEKSGLFILAMGKHGGFELNYSSDIDIVVFYDEERFPFVVGGEKRRAAVEIVKGIVKLLADVTSEGYVFRVDLRLRPDAGATQIAISAGAAEEYYELMGQNWERAAMIKARPCAGDLKAAARFQKNLSPFIWRKYLDFAAIEDIHSIKRQIHAHGGYGAITVLGHNLKLGRGGIREIEFFAQTQQLILGGRDSSLRTPRTLAALSALAARGAISPQAEGELSEAYKFLRRLEHRLQMIEDQQTHELPKTQEGLDRVARFSGFTDTKSFETELVKHLRRVESNYAQLFERATPLSAGGGSLVFTGVEDDPDTVENLARMGFSTPTTVAAAIRSWHHGRIRATRSVRAREILTKLIPSLLDAFSKTADPQNAFVHFDRFISGLPGGVQVFSLLLAHPELLNLVAEITGSAPRLAEYLGRNASVLDALIDPDFLTKIPDGGELQAKFAVERARLSGFEGALDAARRFAREEMFRIGVQVIRSEAEADLAGPAYAAIARTIIANLQPEVEAEIAAAHGRLAGGGFVVTALGKLGGREMTAGSDLDLVFVYTHAADAEQSDGPKPLSTGEYYARTSQRFISALTALTTEGRLYEVDMRLRPSGSQGPVAVSFARFEEYHAEKSWTWERMALTRARVLSGPADLAKKVENVIARSLATPKDRATILHDAYEMRSKIAAQFPGKEMWDLKFAPGGLIDIEFIAQSLQLCYASDADVLDQNTIAALEKLNKAGALVADDTRILIDAARLQHALTQVLRIALEGPFRPESASAGLKALLVRAAKADDVTSLEARLCEAQRAVREIFTRICC
jgi:glutamate-ammonia-ligase adenylyltransferase